MVDSINEADRKTQMSDHQDSVLLNTGTRMPLLGLGTYKLRGKENVMLAVDAALGAGYRHFDTAAVYRNEVEVGQALRELLPKHGISRADVFVTSKLGPRDQGPMASEGCQRSLDQLDLDYIDLFLVHWPGTQGLRVEDPQNRVNRAQTWEILEDFHSRGLFRAIGVSNYTVRHMEELLASCKVVPAVLQVEFHPRLIQKELRALCAERGVCFEAYSSLGTGALLSDPAVLEVASGCKRNTAQVLLKWAVQQNVPVLPKSCNPSRVLENGQLFDFELSQEDMKKLTSLDNGQRFCWDPTLVA
ncbi:glyoxal reductase isoform X2 [Engraulis encrasicolus]|uniref:glyoxal reductase isoform X2 n=1 Tax=Engraulis encrasicolus TaxID=184585 RepID=UPI002FD5D947